MSTHKGRGRWGARPHPDLPARLSYTERQVIIGSLLGDGSLTMYKRSLFPAFRERHSLAQADYLRWKAQLLKSLIPYVREHDAKIVGKTYPGLFLSTRQAPVLAEFMGFYGAGKKTIPEFALAEVDALALAILIQDDGYLRPPRDRLIHPYMEINSQSFSQKNNGRLCHRLCEVLCVENISTIRAANGTGYKLMLGVRATRAIAELCAPHWQPCMDYKFPYPELLKDYR